mmetsp:Transcript_150818/g.420381  ORF Transcript_150818/g.420381 Transcript_150818/m.420381 type:complete len:289 (+) Transcript_150818:42-908(+)
MALRIPQLWEVAPERLTMHEKVGAGRTATVYRGILDGREVAVKEFAVDVSLMSRNERKNLEREVNIMKDIMHPLLVNLVGIMSSQTKLQVITEFCKGGCLFDLLHNHLEIDLAWRQQVKMVCDVAKAMCFLHNSEPQIIHRDLKSLNLLLAEPVLSGDTEPLVKVSDFGTSRIVAKVAGEIMTRNVGTQHWMAPEVLKMELYDEKVDVYSFGMILYEVICREIPFEGESSTKVALLVSHGKRPDMEAIPPDCPLVLHELMMTCWAQDPRKRPSFEEIITTIGPIYSLF